MSDDVENQSSSSRRNAEDVTLRNPLLAHDVRDPLLAQDVRLPMVGEEEEMKKHLTNLEKAENNAAEIKSQVVSVVFYQIYLQLVMFTAVFTTSKSDLLCHHYRVPIFLSLGASLLFFIVILQTGIDYVRRHNYLEELKKKYPSQSPSAPPSPSGPPPSPSGPPPTRCNCVCYHINRFCKSVCYQINRLCKNVCYHINRPCNYVALYTAFLVCFSYIVPSTCRSLLCEPVKK